MNQNQLHKQIAFLCLTMTAIAMTLHKHIAAKASGFLISSTKIFHKDQMDWAQTGFDQEWQIYT